MKLIIQRVSQASVEVEQKTVAAIGPGVLVFVGVTHQDTSTEAIWLAEKLINLRIFSDAQGKTNCSLDEHQGEVLVVSQFTLYADCSTGRRPSFTKAADPALAEQLYNVFIQVLQKKQIKVQNGIFGAHMKISLTNDGPLTLILERASSNL